MIEQRNSNSDPGRVSRAGRTEGWGMLPVLLGLVALLVVGYMVFATNPEAPNTTKNSEYRPTPQAPTTPKPTTPNSN